ncbi:MAG TPA: Spo0E family sporulation regulatory protein-aspartic acid phosphatase [Clostridiaceae bacterium]|jgi:hypothetical protein|nr:Spo0E family sporulation regulatory protein-aspartic acid phosphatase [Clostridiaceae bacterium]
MKNIEKIRSRLNRAIASGDNKNTILNISRRLDNLIVQYMRIQIKKSVN